MWIAFYSLGLALDSVVSSSSIGSLLSLFIPSSLSSLTSLSLALSLVVFFAATINLLNASN